MPVIDAEQLDKLNFSLMRFGFNYYTNFGLNTAYPGGGLAATRCGVIFTRQLTRIRGKIDDEDSVDRVTEIVSNAIDEAIRETRKALKEYCSQKDLEAKTKYLDEDMIELLNTEEYAGLRIFYRGKELNGLNYIEPKAGQESPKLGAGGVRNINNLLDELANGFETQILSRNDFRDPETRTIYVSYPVRIRELKKQFSENETTKHASKKLTEAVNNIFDNARGDASDVKNSEDREAIDNAVEGYIPHYWNSTAAFRISGDMYTGTVVQFSANRYNAILQEKARLSAEEQERIKKHEEYEARIKKANEKREAERLAYEAEKNAAADARTAIAEGRQTPLYMEDGVHKIYVPDSSFRGEDMAEKVRLKQPLFLFKDISYHDAKQNSDKACFFVSTVAAVAKNDPDYIKKLMTDNHDGTVTCHFYALDKKTRQRVPYDVTVDNTTTHLDGGAERWANILEKAYAASGLHKNEGALPEPDQIPGPGANQIFLTESRGGWNGSDHYIALDGGSQAAVLQAFYPPKDADEYDLPEKNDKSEALFRASSEEEAYNTIAEALLNASKNKSPMFLASSSHTTIVDEVTRNEDGEVFITSYNQLNRFGTAEISLRELLNGRAQAGYGPIRTLSVFPVSDDGEMPDHVDTYQVYLVNSKIRQGNSLATKSTLKSVVKESLNKLLETDNMKVLSKKNSSSQSYCVESVIDDRMNDFLDHELFTCARENITPNMLRKELDNPVSPFMQRLKEEFRNQALRPSDSLKKSDRDCVDDALRERIESKCAPLDPEAQRRAEEQAKAIEREREAERQRLEQERREKERIERERIEKERAERERKEKAERELQEKLRKERQEQLEKLEKERQEKLAREKEIQRLKEQREREAREILRKQEEARKEQERLKLEQEERERKEREKLQKEKEERERKEREKLQKEKEERERLQKEREERERKEREKIQKEREERERILRQQREEAEAEKIAAQELPVNKKDKFIIKEDALLKGNKGIAKSVKQLTDAKTFTNSPEYEGIIKSIQNIFDGRIPEAVSNLDKNQIYAAQLLYAQDRVDAYLSHKAKDGVNENVRKKLEAVEDASQKIETALRGIDFEPFELGGKTFSRKSIRSQSYSRQYDKFEKTGDPALNKVPDPAADGNAETIADTCMCKIILRAAKQKPKNWEENIRKFENIRKTFKLQDEKQNEIQNQMNM